MLVDNEAAAWGQGATLRVCGRCEAQTYSEVCPEDCVDDRGAPLELHEGHLTNVVATLRAEGKHAEVADVFAELERICPAEDVPEDQILWAPDVALKKAQEKREREIRAAIGGARG